MALRRVQKIWKGLLAGGAGMAALAALNATIARGANEPDDTALGGALRPHPTPYGDLCYRVAGAENAPPLVFLHSVGAGASAFMWRRNFDPLAADCRVYALDLLGFGHSAKPAAAPYSADLYVEQLANFLRATVGPGAHLVAHATSAPFAVRVADEAPELVGALTLVAPAGVDNRDARPDLPGAAFYGLLHSPVLGTSFYNAMTSERSIRDYARTRLFYDRRLATPRHVAHTYAASHQLGAQHAMVAFLSGFLQTEARAAFARLAQPVTLVWGRQDVTNPIERAAVLLALNPRARLDIFDRARLMPHHEHPDRFNALLRQHLRARSAAA
ncbi:MAG TPA: alpha/beta fold hydrolase [Pyrinomonadaceae bacterium]|jgi:pimeloyl-ACP methyl ester carboxylesterase